MCTFAHSDAPQRITHHRTERICAGQTVFGHASRLIREGFEPRHSPHAPQPSRPTCGNAGGAVAFCTEGPCPTLTDNGVWTNTD